MHQSRMTRKEKRSEVESNLGIEGGGGKDNVGQDLTTSVHVHCTLCTQVEFYCLYGVHLVTLHVCHFTGSLLCTDIQYRLIIIITYYHRHGPHDGAPP